MEELVLSRRKYSVITKSTLVAREAALFAKSQCRVSMSLCSVDDDELRVSIPAPSLTAHASRRCAPSPTPAST